MGLKIPPYTVSQFSNTDPGFYPLIGPFLSRREVVDELGSPVWDDDDKTWLIAHTNEGEVFGFVSLQPGPHAATIRSLYVIPDARHEVIGSTLVLRIRALWPDTPIRATATPASVELFTLCDFTETGTRGRFTCMEWTP